MKIASVPYLNARPLVHGLDNHPHPDMVLDYAVPSRLIAQLCAGEVDIAMASTFALLEHPALHLLPGLGVTTAGPAWSVRLLSRVSPAQIRTLALDASSRSTNALARIILADRYGVLPECVTVPPDLPTMLTQADAAVLIGDIGMAVDGQGLYDLDLGAEWWALTGLPFYFAGWLAHDPAVLQQAAPCLFAACDFGLAHLETIAADAAVRLRLPYARCYRYLVAIMRYRTGEAEEAGLAEFRRRAERLGLVSLSGAV